MADVGGEGPGVERLGGGGGRQDGVLTGQAKGSSRGQHLGCRSTGSHCPSLLPTVPLGRPFLSLPKALGPFKILKVSCCLHLQYVPFQTDSQVLSWGKFSGKETTHAVLLNMGKKAV